MISVTPYIPSSITVHLGAPSANVQNVTVSFTDYLKNVASSEIYPTWDESALRANILAITSFALNRVYTEFYRSRGYNFDITSSTAYDQAFVNGRNYFRNIESLVDELFNDYIRRQNFVEPLAAKFCNGTTVTCEGLSQWGSQYLATQGYSSISILRNYYGSNIELVQNAPIRGISSSYPGEPLRVGSSGPYVVIVQTQLNRISQNYPAIPKINPVDGIFGSRTEASVRRFQEIFGLTPDGVVGSSTWYELVRLYVGVNALSELRSQGQRFYGIQWEYPQLLRQGSTGEKVRHLQYMLAVLSEFIPAIPPVEVDGIFGPATESAVLAAQRYLGLAQDGIVGEQTWDGIYDQFIGIEAEVFDDAERFPFGRTVSTAVGSTAPDRAIPAAAFQQVRTGTANSRSSGSSADSGYAAATRMTQFPGFDLGVGDRDIARREET